MNTKDRILEAALTLFSEYGYDGTSVEKIAEAVGIKAPSLYKHFKGKEDILNTIIDVTEKMYAERFGTVHTIEVLPDSKEEFIQNSLERFGYTLNDPNIRKIRIFMAKEQFRNERLASINTIHQMVNVQSILERMLAGMMETGVVKRDDPKMLAMQLAAPSILLISKSDRQPGGREEILKEFESYVRHFCDVYMTR